MDQFKSFIECAKLAKLELLSNSENGDMPPAVFASKNGKLICGVICDQNGKYHDIEAVRILRAGVGIDSFMAVSDARIRLAADMNEFNEVRGQNLERLCKEENAIERGIVSECLICTYYGVDKKFKLVTMPYKYGGKSSGRPLEWTDFGGHGEKESECIESESYFIKSFREAMSMRPFTEVEENQNVISDSPLSAQDFDALICQQTIQYLVGLEYTVVDMSNEGEIKVHCSSKNFTKLDFFAKFRNVGSN